MNKIEFAGKRPGEDSSVTESDIEEFIEAMRRNGDIYSRTSKTLNPADIPPDWLIVKSETEGTEPKRAFNEMFTRHLERNKLV